MRIQSATLFLRRSSIFAAVILLHTGCAHHYLGHATTQYEMTGENALPAGVAAPRVVHAVPPLYPYRLVREFTEGRVLLLCRIDATGRLQKVEVENTSHSEFVTPAIAAVRKWDFAPGTRNGKPIPMDVAIPIKFVLSL